MSVRILGIESSCDETAAAIVADGREILSSVVASQIDIHRKYGGVVPELASREHLRQIVPVVREALAQANLNFSDLAAVGVTQGPGLVGSLLVGITYGKTLAHALNKPLVPVNHLEGHVHAVFLEAHKSGLVPELPAVCLIVSGGHTVLYEVRAEQGTRAEAAAQLRYRKIGQTRDDAAGEAYDKVSKLLGLGYPGGPILDRLAAVAGTAAAPVKFGPIKMKGNPLDFSFSGLKTAVLYYIREHQEYAPEIAAREAALERGERKFDQLLPLCSPQTLALVREFQNTVVRDLRDRTFAAAEQSGASTILVSGGVAANAQLRSAFEERGQSSGIQTFFPSRALSTDNAAMIAAAAYPRFRAGILADTSLNATASLPLA
ncbi:MAG: tRNA (adenosine(37)-N6)-threonylcarbamoyltransferase complex transferase subunit TsaD [Acidobacteria bacterium]|nr:tRNA (adenosine(37)-N6)-threonylcarbamoyltransferase complex transferase subunit TsaD [Acidobacteriota bacterium]MBS1865779.1 tRNA (adenosine(37)-N6)-threonylcarbamoyltransferase complex transferase subunit TsaD [Acidobacteriota bacterium]